MLRIQRPRRKGRFPTADPATLGGQKASRYRGATLHEAQILCGGFALLVGRLGVWSGDVEATGGTSETQAGRQFLNPMAVARCHHRDIANVTEKQVYCQEGLPDGSRYEVP